MSHANARLTPKGRTTLVDRIGSGWTIDCRGASCRDQPPDGVEMVVSISSRRLGRTCRSPERRPPSGQSASTRARCRTLRSSAKAGCRSTRGVQQAALHTDVLTAVWRQFGYANYRWRARRLIRRWSIAGAAGYAGIAFCRPTRVHWLR